MISFGMGMQHASMHANLCTCTMQMTRDSTFEDAFKGFVKEVLKSDAVQRIIVHHSNLWEDSLKQFIKLQGLSCNKTIKVTFVGEPAIDSKGPHREYFTLLIRAIAMNNSLFEGDTDQRLPRVNVSAFIYKEYLQIGRMIGASWLHGRSSPFLANSVDYIIKGFDGATIQVSEIADDSVQNMLMQVQYIVVQISVHSAI